MKKNAARAPRAPITVVTQQRLTAVVGGTGGTIISQNLLPDPIVRWAKGN